MTIEQRFIAAEDGTRLACLVALPDGEGPFPALLARTPYDKASFADAARSWAAAGFAYVAQDVRGRYGSEGDWLPYSCEEADGRSALRWIHAQPWCGGRVALEGGSYGAFAAFAAAQGDADGLAAALVALVPAMGLRDTAYHSSGAFHLMDRLWWDACFGSSRVGEPETFRRLFGQHRRALYHLPVSELPAVFPMPLPHWRRACDPGAAQERIRLGDIRLPALHIGGWHDAFIGALLHNYAALSGSAKAGKQALIVGLWTHEVNKPARFDAREAGRHAALPLGRLETNWLKHAMLGEALRFPPVLVYAMGADRWLAPPAWPLPGATARSFYLNGSAARLQDARPAGPDEPGRYRYDPADPMPSREYPSFRQDLEARGDVLLYTSEPLEAELLLAGAARLRLWVDSTAAATDFYACLSEVDGDGRSIYIASGLAAVRSESADRPIRGQEIELAMKPVCQLLPRGCRLRLTIGSSCFPEFARSLNLPGDRLQTAEYAVADQTVRHDAAYPSCLILPVHSDALERWSYVYDSSL